jgi:DNA methylase
LSRSERNQATAVRKSLAQSSLGTRATGWNFSRRDGFSGRGSNQRATVYLKSFQLPVEGCIATARMSNSPNLYGRVNLVLDPFAGSNTTGAVAEGLHRRWLAMDTEETYLAPSTFRFADTAVVLSEDAAHFLA